MDVLHSRRFWTLIIDSVVSLVIYFGTKYMSPAMMDDAKFAIAMLQPIAAFLIAAYTVNDAQDASLAHQVTMAKLNAGPPHG